MNFSFHRRARRKGDMAEAKIQVETNEARGGESANCALTSSHSHNPTYEAVERLRKARERYGAI